MSFFDEQHTPAPPVEKAPAPEFTPGIQYDLAEDVYHKIDALGSSPLKRFHDCPALALEPIKVTEDMKLGSAVDCYVLYGREEFFRRFEIMPDFGDMRSPKNREERDRWTRDVEGDGKTCLPATVKCQAPEDDEDNQCGKIPTLRAIEAVDNFLYNEHPMTKIIMRQGDRQMSLFWYDRETGERCKGRIDFFPPESYQTIFDLKKCGNIANFHFQIEKLRYFLQAGTYTTGAIENGLDVIGFAFIGFNFGIPPKVRIVSMADEYLEKSVELAKTTIRMIHECRMASKWPKYEIPLNTVSIAHMLGLESPIARQLTPFDLMEEIQTPWGLKDK